MEELLISAAHYSKVGSSGKAIRFHCARAGGAGHGNNAQEGSVGRSHVDRQRGFQKNSKHWQICNKKKEKPSRLCNWSFIKSILGADGRDSSPIQLPTLYCIL